MNLASTKDTFIKAVSLTAQVIDPRPNLPVLNNFLFKANQGNLEITATNLETTIKYKLPVKVEKEGSITIPAKVLLDFCLASDGDKINISTEKDSAVITVGMAKAVLPTISPEEFPALEDFGEGKPVEMEKQKWLDAVSAVSFCASPEGGRPILSGVLIDSSDKILTFVATDGYRLAKKETDVKEVIEVVVPTRALQISSKALAEQEDEAIELSTDKNKNQLQIKTKNLNVTTRLLSGDFPNYEQIIPTSFVVSVELSAKEFSDAVKLAALFAREVGNVVRIGIEDKALSVSASTAQIGEAQTKIEAKVDGEKIKTAFNSRFLLESLAATKSNRISLSLSGPTSAALIRGLDNERLVYVVMPVRIQS